MISRRRHLQIFIRSNSTVDAKSVLLNNITNPQNDTPEKIPNVCTTPTNAKIAKLGRRYSSINEEDLKTTIKNLRTPTPLEGKEFCWSSTSVQQPRSFPISPLAVENTTIKDRESEISENL